MKRLIIYILCMFSFMGVNAQEKVYMTYEKSGIYTIPCEVNGLKLRFVFDTGAADVSLSLIEAAFMLKNGYIDKEDFIGVDTYSLADGSVSDNMIVNLKTIKIGSKKLYNVKACISSKIKASLLLGQSAIMKLGKYTVEGNVLTLYPSSSTSTQSAYSSPYTSTLLNGKSTKAFTIGTYTGNFVDGKRDGFGTMTYNNGSSYKGNWENDKFSGKGTYTWKNGDKYTGDFTNGYRDGYGTFTWANGDKYVGQMKNGERSGKGKITFSDGASYDGEWLAGKKNGTGTQINKNGDEYIGNFVDNVKSGKGVCYYVTGNKYDGEWSNNEYNGTGTYTWNNGASYTGGFKNGLRDGYGTYTWNNGDKYSGNWSNNKQNGYGTYYYANGGTKYGTWKDGKYVDTNSNYGGSSYGSTSSGSLNYGNSSTSSYGKSSSYDNVTTYGNGSSYNSSSYSSPSTYTYKQKSYYTAYTTTALNLREGPSKYYNATTKIPEGEWIFMDADERYKEFAKVMYIKTGEEGYVSTSYLDGYTAVAINDKGSLEVTGKTYSKYAEINLNNDANVTAKITLGDKNYTLAPNSSKKLKYIEGGKYNIVVSSPGIVPYVGVDTVEGGYAYSWRFFITTVKK